MTGKEIRAIYEQQMKAHQGFGPVVLAIIQRLEESDDAKNPPATEEAAKGKKWWKKAKQVSGEAVTQAAPAEQKAQAAEPAKAEA
jgi:hypothetical protein